MRTRPIRFYEIGAPASLPLGLVQLARGGAENTALLGLTVQHPPVHLMAEASASLDITGPRADIAHRWATRFLQAHNLEARGKVEVELAIPAFAGLGSETVLALATATSLAWLHALPSTATRTPEVARGLGLEPHCALEVWGYDQGGLLLVGMNATPGDMPPVLFRREISHPEKEAWVFVLLIPRTPAGLPWSLESDRLHTCLKAARHLSLESRSVVEADIRTAIANDDIDTFGRSLMHLQHMNHEALEHEGMPAEISPDEQRVLKLIQDHGSVAWGRSLNGLCLYGLIRGSKASVELRKVLRAELGHFAGIIMATITDNVGSRVIFKDEFGAVVEPDQKDETR